MCAHVCVCPLAAWAVATAFYFLTALTPLRSFMVADSVGRSTADRRGYWHGRAWRVWTEFMVNMLLREIMHILKDKEDLN